MFGNLAKVKEKIIMEIIKHLDLNNNRKLSKFCMWLKPYLCM